MSTDFHYDIRDLGACGDGSTMNTVAIQEAIDQCSQGGGGTVVIPPGEFLSGTLYLRDHVHLHLAPGAVLKASPHSADYNADAAFPQNHVSTHEHVSGAHFILGICVVDVTISGQGTIDGNESVFRGELIEPDDAEPYFGPPAWRPGQMILFCESSDIQMEGIRLRNAPYWHLFLHGCRNIRIRGLDIQTDRRTRNGDGIDLDCCVKAVVSDCIIDTSDDCITVRANGKLLTKTPALSERISVSNCVLRSRTCGIRVGVGTGVIRNIVFSDLEMTEVKSGIHVQGNYSPSSEGVEIDTLRFNNISINGRVAFHITAGFEGTKPIRNLFISNVNARCDATSYLGGSSLRPLENCYFDNVHLTFEGGQANRMDQPSPYELYRDDSTYSARAIGMPYPLYLEYVKGIHFRRLTLQWATTNGLWLDHVGQKHAEFVTFKDTRIDPTPNTNPLPR